MKRPIAAAALASSLVLLAGCSAVSNAAGGQDPADYTCASLAKDAADLGASSTGVSLLKVRGLTIETDNRDTYVVPTGSKEATVLTCVGQGVYSDDEKVRTRVKATIDSDSEIFVAWEPVT